MPRPLGTTSLRILAAVRDGIGYGLEIIDQTGMPSGTVYPTLSRLSRAGLLKGRWEDQRVAEREGRTRRKYYELTAEGSAVLSAAMEQVAILARQLEGADTGGLSS